MIVIPSSGRARWLGLAALVLAATTAVATYRAHPRERAPRSLLAPPASALRYRYSIGKVAAAQDVAATIAALEDRLRTTPTPFDYAELGDLYLRKAQSDGTPDDYRTAEAMARRSLALLPAPNGAVLTLAKLAEIHHDFPAAIALARQHKKRSASVQLLLATAQLALGQLVDAEASARAALAIKPDSAGHLMRALVLQAQGRDAETARAFADAARLEEPGDLPAAARLRALWARFLLRRGALDDAGRVLDEALRIAPGFALALAYRGELALRAGDARGAARWFEQAFADSRQVRYLIDQARALQLAGAPAQADALRDQVEAMIRSELGEGGLGHRLELVEVLVDRDRQLPEAVALARTEVARRPSFDARFQLARALARTGDLDGAMQEVDAALALGTREAQLYELASRLEALRGHLAGAALYARLADQLDPRNAGWRSLGLVGGAR